jgi:hypothetical protein
MTLPIEVLTEIGTALNQRGVGSANPCPVCGQRTLTLNGEGFITLAVSEHPLDISLGGRGFPLIPLVCGNCGNTILINLYNIGLGEVVERLKKKTSGSTSDG